MRDLRNMNGRPGDGATGRMGESVNVRRCGGAMGRIGEGARGRGDESAKRRNGETATGRSGERVRGLAANPTTVQLLVSCRPVSGSPSRQVALSPARPFAPSPFCPLALRRRRGSILIMVVALLVLIALIGTAYVSVARIDRQAAATGSTNTQMDLMADSVAQQTETMILNNLFVYTSNGINSGSYYRPAMPPAGAVASYHNYDSPLDDRDGWLASRVPQHLDVEDTTSIIVWPAVSLLWNNATPATTDHYDIEDPTSPSTPAYQLVVDPSASFNSTGLKFRYRFEPTSRVLTPGGPSYPAMNIYTVGTSTFATTGANLATLTNITPAGKPVLAADADGDGIADSLYFKLNSQPDSGITYYGAIRVIDNNSAVNASTAWTYSGDLLGGGALAHNWGFFPSNVGLEEMLHSYIPGAVGAPPTSTEMQALDRYRFGSSTMTEAGLPVLTGPNADPYDDPSVSNAYISTAATAYQFITYGNLMGMQLDRRLDNPGYEDVITADSGTAPYRLRALSWADNVSLADRFCLASGSAGSSLESAFTASLITGVRTQPYDPSKVGVAGGAVPGTWFYDNFDYDADGELNGTSTFTASTYRPRRALLVARDPVSDNVPWDTNVLWGGGNGQQFTATTVGGVTTTTPNKPPTRANLNTSDFSDLQNAFLGVMDHCDNVLSPFQSILSTVNSGYTISGVTTSLLSGTDVQKLRAALAAINAIAMRRQAFTTVVTNGTLAESPSVPLSGGKKAYVYAATVQPYITEVAISEVYNQTSYIAMKIYNPYSTPIDMSGWQLASFTPGGTGLVSVYTFPASTSLAATSAVYFTSGTPPQPQDGGTATKPAFTLATPPSAKSVSPPTPISQVYGTAFILIRPTAGTAIGSLTNPAQFAPVDQVDCTGLAKVAPYTSRLVYYIRSEAADQFIYAGRDGNTFVGAPAGSVAVSAGNWRVLLYSLSDSNTLTSDSGAAPSVDDYNLTSGFGAALQAFKWTTDVATVAPMPISLPLNTLASFPSPNPISGATGNKFPFGGFARDGDAFKIPFIGGYVITDAPTSGPPTTIFAIDGISYDSAYAEDRDPIDDAQELVGQFCPIASGGNPTNTLAGYPNASAPDDYFVPIYQTTGNVTSAALAHRYYFARSLLNYVGAVNTPDSDYAPNIDLNNGPVAQSSIQEVANDPSLHPAPQTTAEIASKDNSTLANHSRADATTPATPPTYDNEYDQPVEGLININTAPWPVLAMLPMATDGTGNVDPAANTALAKAIVAYRDRNGPFQSVLDLNKVVLYTTGVPQPSHAFYSGWVNPAGTPYLGTMNLGDTTLIGAWQQDCTNLSTPLASAFAANSGTASFDFYQAKDRMNMLTRISNLITTRSDSFTVYIVIEGWKNAGTARATRVSQVRQAYIVDRSHVSGLNKTLKIIPVPTN